MPTVFLLFHTREAEINDLKGSKLLGVYSTRARAEARIATARALSGFRRYPAGFTIDEYVVDTDMWENGSPR